jgi:serine/threonine protein kinase
MATSSTSTFGTLAGQDVSPAIYSVDGFARQLSPVAVPYGSQLASHLSNGHFNQHFGKGDIIGQGGFGFVFKATHKLENTEYAVKFVPVNVAADEEIGNSRDFREITSMIHFRGSKHVVRYLTCWIEEPQFLPIPQQTSPVSRRLSAKQSFQAVAKSAAAMGRMSESTSEDTSLVSQRFEKSSLQRGSPISGHSLSSSSSSLGIEFVADSRASEVVDSRVSAHKVRNADLGSKQDLDGPSKSEGASLFNVVLAIQMELVRGETLQSWLRNREPADIVPRAPILTVEIELGRQLLKAMKEVHSYQIIHRDLKPANVFVTSGSTPTLKIADFGLSRDLNAEPLTSMPPTPQGGMSLARHSSGRVGTPGYIAPECGSFFSDKSDVYAASFILLELLCPKVMTSMELDAFRQHGRLPAHLCPYGDSQGEMAPFGKLLVQMRSTLSKERPNAAECYKAWLRATEAVRKSDEVPTIPEGAEEDGNASSDSSASER